MNWLAVDALGGPWRRAGSVMFVVLAAILPAAPHCAAQVLTKGVSVQQPLSRHAVAMPQADAEDALIVVITHSGSVFLGTTPVTPAALAEKRGLSARAGKKLYIKADARSSYAAVMAVLAAVRTAGFPAPVLLTAQNGPAAGVPVPPQGLVVHVGPPLPSAAESMVLQVITSGQPSPLLKVNRVGTPWDALESKLAPLLRHRTEKAVLLEGDGALPFMQVVHVIDVCHSMRAEVFLATTLTPSAAIGAGLSVAGTWRGEINGLPAVVLTIHAEGRSLSGAILFYFQHRNTEKDPWEVDTAHSTPLPLIRPEFDGKTLTFQVSHKEAHPPRTLHDPPSSFQFRLTANGEAELLNLTENHSPPLKMVRDNQ